MNLIYFKHVGLKLFPIFIIWCLLFYNSQGITFDHSPHVCTGDSEVTCAKFTNNSVTFIKKGDRWRPKPSVFAVTYTLTNIKILHGTNVTHDYTIGDCIADATHYGGNEYQEIRTYCEPGVTILVSQYHSVAEIKTNGIGNDIIMREGHTLLKVEFELPDDAVTDINCTRRYYMIVTRGYPRGFWEIMYTGLNNKMAQYPVEVHKTIPDKPYEIELEGFFNLRMFLPLAYQTCSNVTTPRCEDDWSRLYIDWKERKSAQIRYWMLNFLLLHEFTLEFSHPHTERHTLVYFFGAAITPGHLLLGSINVVVTFWATVFSTIVFALIVAVILAFCRGVGFNACHKIKKKNKR